MFRKFGIDFKATLPQTAIGLIGGVVVFKYFIRPTIHNRHDDTSHTTKVYVPHESARPLPPKQSSKTIPQRVEKEGEAVVSSLVQELDGNETLEVLGTSRSVILITRGFPKDVAEDSLKIFTRAAEKLSSKFPNENLKFFVVSEISSQTHAMALLGRLGLSNSYPYVVIMDDFKGTENKYLDTKPGSITRESVESFVTKFIRKEIKPALLGQERSKDDKNPYCATLTEVVTDSFYDIVLDKNKDVLLQTYTTRCDACKAFSARYRTLSQLVKQFWGDSAPTIAAMNVLDNDKDFRYLPEKYTPAIRFFPAVTNKMAEKEGFVLDILSSANSGSLAPMHYARDANGTTVYLPTLVDLLEFMVKHSKNNLTISEEMRKLAEEQEVTCAYLESAYETCLNFMQLWKAFMDVIEDWDYNASKTQDKDGSIRSGLERRKRDAETLKQKIVQAYNFIVNESCTANFSTVLDQLDDISLMITHHGIREAIDAATKDAKNRIESQKSSEMQ